MGEIKTKISLEGEKEYKQKLSESQRQLKLLGTEMKAETKVFDSNGKAVVNWNKKAELMRKEVDQQQKIVKLMEDRMEKLKVKYGENSSQVENFQQKLNNAKAALNDMNGKLQEADSNSVNWGNALVTASDAAGTALVTLGATAGAIFAGIAAAAKSGVDAINDMENQTADHADDLLTRSQQSGFSTDDLQEMDYAGRFVDTTTDSIISSVQKFRQAMNDTGNQVDLATILGVNYQDATGQAKQPIELFWESIQALNDRYKAGTFNPDSQEGGTFLQTMFGRGWNDLGPIIKYYDDYKAKRDEFQSNDLGMSEEMVQQFGYLSDLREQWSAIKTSVTETIASFFVSDWTTFYQNLNQAGIDLNKFLRGDQDSTALAEDLKKLFTDIEGSIQNAVKKWGELKTSFQQSDDANLQAIGAAMQTIENAFDWIVKNQDNIKTAFETILSVFIAGKTVAAMNKLSDLLLKVKMMAAMSGGSTATGTSAAETAATGAGATGANTAASAAGSLSWLSGFANMAAFSAIPLLQQAFESLGNMLVNKSTEYRENAVTANEGRWQVSDAAAAQAAAQAFADAYSQKGAWMDGSEFTELTGAIEDAVGDADVASEIVSEITNATTVGEAWTVPDTWFSDISSGVENSVTEGVNTALEKPYSTTVYANVVQSGSVLGGIVSAASSALSGFSSFFGNNSHATGLLDVPYDGYSAILHKGETVLTASQGARWRAGNSGANATFSSKQIDRLANGIASAMSGMAVNMDGRTVGTLIAPAVSEAIAQGMA